MESMQHRFINVFIWVLLVCASFACVYAFFAENTMTFLVPSVIAIGAVFLLRFFHSKRAPWVGPVVVFLMVVLLNVPGSSVRLDTSVLLRVFVPVIVSSILLDFRWTVIAMVSSFAIILLRVYLTFGSLTLLWEKFNDPMIITFMLLVIVSLAASWTRDVMLNHEQGLRTEVQKFNQQLEARVQERTHQLEVSRDEAQAANRAKSAFLATMSHELRTPLNAILGYSELLKEQAEHQLPSYVGKLDRIHAAGSHLLHLISEILDLSKIEADQMQVELQVCSLKQVVDTVIMQMEPLFAKQSNIFSCDLPADLPPISTDPMRLKQIVLNLLSNANKFTENGTIYLTVEQVEQAAQPWLHIEVQDSGIGMSPDQLQLLFKPFVQVDSSTTRRYGGTGLGLALSQRLARLLGGSITVDSTPDVGSTFHVWLPWKTESLV